MAITSYKFIVLLLAVSAAALAWSVLGGPTRRTVLGALARLAQHLLVIGLAILTVAAFLNRQNEWYTSWSELLGSTHPAVVTTNAGAGRVPDPSGLGAGAGRSSPIAAGGEPLPDPGSRDQTFTVVGSASGLTGTVLVHLPVGYDDPANAHRTYPVIEALHGYPGSPDEWTRGGIHIVSALDTLTRQHQIRDAVIVAPQLEFPAGADTECVNGNAGQPQVETWLAKDVPAAMDQRLRLADGPGSWATVGFSAGGWCAAMLTMLHPDVFGSAIVLGGYMSPDFGRSYVPFHPGDPLFRHYDLVAEAAQAPPPVALWLQTSKADHLSYDSSAALVRAARSPLSVRSQVELDAGHRIGVWASAVPAALTWLGSTMSGFRPAA